MFADIAHFARGGLVGGAERHPITNGYSLAYYF